MREYTVEKDWITAAGLRAVVIMGSLGFRCGYVGVPPGHPLYGIDYSQETDALAPVPEHECIGKRGIIPMLCAAANGARLPQSPEMVFDVHGSITYSGESKDYPVDSDLWWFGFDCGHAGDGRSPEYLQKHREQYPDKPFMWSPHDDGEHRSIDYCAAECESLAQQITEKTKE